MPDDLIKLAIEKLDTEAKDFKEAEVFAKYLKGKCQTDLELAENINKTDKTLKGLLSYVISEARKKASNSVAVIDSNTIFKWAENYYGIEKPVITEDDVAVATYAVKKGASTNITETKKHVEPKKIKNSQLENQISILDFM